MSAHPEPNVSEAFDKDRQDRLRREAAFQDQRTREGEGEPRERFYWVISGAYADFRAACRALAGRRVLVVGCAEGEVTPLARLGAEVVGIDISGEAIDRQRAAIAERTGARPAVRVESRVALLPYAEQALVDPFADLSRARQPLFSHAEWITPLVSVLAEDRRGRGTSVTGVDGE